MATWQITVRYGTRYQRYHTLQVQADDIRGALREAAAGVPDEITDLADLAEIRIAVDPDARTYLGEDG